MGPYILLGHGEAEQGGAEKNSILCDIVESLIGATFLEHGIDEARKVIHRLIDDTLAEVATEGPALDWKTSLTVKAHELGLDEPRYRMSVSGPEYAQEFTAKGHHRPERRHHRQGYRHQQAQGAARRGGNGLA